MANVVTPVSRQELHTLVEQIIGAEVPRARKALVDPVALAFLHAPPGAEPLSADERAALEAGELGEQRGEPLISHEQILLEFGLTGREP